MVDKLRFCVIGCGKMGTRRIKTIKENPKAELICLVDIDEKKVKKLTKEHGCSYYTDHREALKRDDVNCVTVSVPHKLHVSIAINALKNKKHVFCEKPLATTYKEACDMIKVARENDVFLKVGANLRFFPNVMKAKELLDSNKIGKIVYLRGWIGNSGGHLKNSWFSDPSLAGGGTFIDNGPHIIDICRWFLGDVKECFGHISNVYWNDIPLEDIGFGILKFKNGQMAFIQSSWADWTGYFYMEIYGTEGYIRIDSRDRSCKTIVGDKKGSQTIFDFSLLSPQSYKLEFEKYVDCILEGRQPMPSGEDGSKVIEIVEKLYESAKLGKKVEF